MPPKKKQSRSAPGGTPSPDEIVIRGGRKQEDIHVSISYRIIELFSEGLYSSPHKAVEELVANSFDANATQVWVVLPPDLTAPTARIAVIDDGDGMDAQGFRDHWVIGASNKRTLEAAGGTKRQQIGKFGIGKLATFVLAQQFSHVSKRKGKYYALSMDYRAVPTGGDKGIGAGAEVRLPLRELTRKEAEAALGPWTRDKRIRARLFGADAASSWTAAILGHLKPLAANIQRGRLSWLLETAMPLRDDFKLFLDGKKIESSKRSKGRIADWVIGSDALKQIPAPAPAAQTQTIDLSLPTDDPSHFGLEIGGLGRVSGYVEIFSDPLDTGKSENIDRSNGFFVYVRGRLINADDAGFGIDRNKLRHGTFSRFRAVLHINALDSDLRSSRESLADGSRYNAAKNVAHGLFNLARSTDEKALASASLEERVAAFVADTPAGLTRHALANLLDEMASGRYSPRTVVTSSTEALREKALELRSEPAAKSSAPFATEISEGLAPSQPLAVYVVDSGVIQINALHPFVAHFLSDFEELKQSVPLALLAVSEVLLEAQMISVGADPEHVSAALLTRDRLLRELAHNSGRRVGRLVAQELEDAVTDEHRLEKALVAVFDAMGFEASPIGGSGKPDGIAEAQLTPTATIAGSYRVTLEAKSKEDATGTVSTRTVNVGAVARHRDEYFADHALVVGPDFADSNGPNSTLAREIARERKANPHKSVTAMRAHDVARLLRLMLRRRLGLHRLKELFENCSLPSEAANWVDQLEAEPAPKSYIPQILAAIHAEKKTQPLEPVDYGALRLALRSAVPERPFTNAELQAECEALGRLVPRWILATDKSVELYTTPELVIRALHAAIGDEDVG